MGARLDPAKYAGLAEGDAHIIHHTDCGLETLTDEVMRKLLPSSQKTASIDASGWHGTGSGRGSPKGKYLRWSGIANPGQRVLEEMQRIPPGSRKHFLYGYI